MIELHSVPSSQARFQNIGLARGRQRVSKRLCNLSVVDMRLRFRFGSFASDPTRRKVRDSTPQYGRRLLRWEFRSDLCRLGVIRVGPTRRRVRGMSAMPPIATELIRLGDLTRCATSGLMHRSNYCASNCNTSFDNFVGEGHQHRRHVEAERLGGLEIDDEFELRWLLDWNIRRLMALQDFVDEIGRAPVELPAIGSIGCQSAGGDKFPIRVDREQPKGRREIDNLLTKTEQ